MFGASRNLRQPATRGATIDWGHPLSAGLTSAFLFRASDPVVDLVDGVLWPKQPGSTTTGATTTTRAAGNGIVDDSGQTGQGFKFDTVPSRFRVNVASTFWYGIPLSGGLAHQSPFITIEHDNFGGSPFGAYGIFRNDVVDTTLVVQWNNGSSQSLSVTSAWTNDRPTTVGMTIDGTTVIAYAGGKNIGSTTTNVGTIAYAASASGYVAVDAGNARGMIFTSCAYTWSRALSAGEMAWLNADPFAPIGSAGARLPAYIPISSAFGRPSSAVVPILTVQQW